MRLHDWPQRLATVLEASRRTPFAYGVHDCCTHAADGIEALTGRDVAADWRGRYATPEAGMELAGVKTLAALARRYFKPVPPALARRGDIALALGMEPPGADCPGGRRGMMLAIVDGAMLRGPAGTVAPRGAAVRAWRVE